MFSNRIHPHMRLVHSFATLKKCEHLGSLLFLQKKEWGKKEFSKLHELPYFIGNISVLKFSGKMIFIPIPYMSYIHSCSSNDTVVVANCQLGRSQRGRSNKTQFVGHFFKLFDITVKCLSHVGLFRSIMLSLES